MTVLTPVNAFPGIPFPNNLSGRSKPQSYIYPGGGQPRSGITFVLSYTRAFLGIAFPQHLSGQASVQSFTYPGAVQPILPVAIWPFTM